MCWQTETLMIYGFGSIRVLANAHAPVHKAEPVVVAPYCREIERHSTRVKCIKGRFYHLRRVDVCRNTMLMFDCCILVLKLLFSCCEYRTHHRLALLPCRRKLDCCQARSN